MSGFNLKLFKGEFFHSLTDSKLAFVPVARMLNVRMSTDILKNVEHRHDAIACGYAAVCPSPGRASVPEMLSAGMLKEKVFSSYLRGPNFYLTAKGYWHFKSILIPTVMKKGF